MKGIDKQVNRNDRNKKAQVAQRKSLAEQQLARANQALERISAINQMRDEIGDGGSLRFRLFYDADGTEVTLLETVAGAGATE